MKRGAPMKRSRLRPVSKKMRGRGWPVLGAARRHVLARTSMAPVGYCEFTADPEHWGPLDMHHCVKKSQGGTNEPSNLVRLCRRHHDMTDLPFSVGRLVIERKGAQRFRMTIIKVPNKWAART